MLMSLSQQEILCHIQTPCIIVFIIDSIINMLDRFHWPTEVMSIEAIIYVSISARATT